MSEKKKEEEKILRAKNKDFRDKLVISFHRRWAVKDIVWPSRTGKMKAKNKIKYY